MKPMPEKIDQKVRELKKQGDEISMKENYLLAAKKYKEALDVLPQPISQWKYTFILLLQLADCYFYNAKFNNSTGGGYQEALDVYQQIMQIEGAVGKASFHSRIGQIRYELGHFEKAKDELLRAYLIKGMDEFSYMDDSKYFELISPVIEDVSYQNNINNSNYKF
ncbi:MAG: tetratricopeptide repeat protein [Bacteroidia bacterium]|nr:tetratricopeptide repeat protein [Bacteroidia bacterium]